MAVPALRVLEDKDGKKIKKNVNGGVFVKGSGISIPDSEDGTVIHVIDERGFVDGVKVARKCSKANVLGKAVEYIRVLKKRENRLKAEKAGLKTLVAGLVGGLALLKEWEREWRSVLAAKRKMKWRAMMLRVMMRRVMMRTVSMGTKSLEGSANDRNFLAFRSGG